MSVQPVTHVISLPQQPDVLKINPDAVTPPLARTDGSLSGHQPPLVPVKLGLRDGHLHIEIPRRHFSLIKKGQIRWIGLQLALIVCLFNETGRAGGTAKTNPIIQESSLSLSLSVFIYIYRSLHLSHSVFCGIICQPLFRKHRQLLCWCFVVQILFASVLHKQLFNKTQKCRFVLISLSSAPLLYS